MLISSKEKTLKLNVQQQFYKKTKPQSFKITLLLVLMPKGVDLAPETHILLLVATNWWEKPRVWLPVQHL